MNILRILKKADIILIIGLLLFGAVFNIGLYTLLNKDGAKIKISVNGKIEKTLNLNIDSIYEIVNEDKTNVIEVKDGKAKMLSSNCKDKYCTIHNPINKTNETIVCLPNKIVIEVEYGEIESEFDSITFNFLDKMRFYS